MAESYLCGLLKCEKGHANMERIDEVNDKENYHAYHHFISESKWSARDVLDNLAGQVSSFMLARKKANSTPTGYIIDESSHLKKGKSSVGVGRQYAGVIGKVDNCQVGVYASLCNGTEATLINEKLFLPKTWTDDPKRCEKAGIPKGEAIYRTKPQLALEMIDHDILKGVEFDWIGGDGLYGHNTELTKGLDERGLMYLLDVHKDERVFLSEPTLSKPVNTGNRGRPSQKLQADVATIRLDEYAKGLTKNDWSKVKVRKTAKGWLVLNIHVCKVWHWDGEEEQARLRTLIITRSRDKQKRTKYSFSNADINEYTLKEFAYFQSQRYWVERCFDDTKNEIGLSDYQVRKWVGWHHHHALVMLAAFFLLKERAAHKNHYPLMSTRDARILIIAQLFGTEEQYQQIWRQMITRHKARHKDIMYSFERQKKRSELENCARV
ncbi:MAG: IS701 family transposase [Bacteroidales bacterium]|nr:IS701 family transposase [Bacteroidales bacterium]MCF8456789.1 IS701 family transposase [Bacteroidales bacterium]